jgi:hypothetical protein
MDEDNLTFDKGTVCEGLVYKNGQADQYCLKEPEFKWYGNSNEEITYLCRDCFEFRCYAIQHPEIETKYSFTNDRLAEIYNYNAYLSDGKSFTICRLIEELLVLRGKKPLKTELGTIVRNRCDNHE